MVPAREAMVPQFDAIILRMMSTDSPVDGKSAFQMVWINGFDIVSQP
jgi:DNA mismatch repair ATPase MutS